MQVVKYFYEEPAALEVLSGDTDADARRRDSPVTGRSDSWNDRQGIGPYYRGYLAASDLETGRIGATVLSESITRLMDAVLPVPRLHFSSDGMAGGSNTHRSVGEAVSSVTDALRQPVASFDKIDTWHSLRDALADRAHRSLIVCGLDTPSSRSLSVNTILQAQTREVLAPVTELLDAGGIVLISEPSHDGHDWTVFSPEPLSDRVRAIMERQFTNITGFVIPFARARGEHKFYFEQYDLDLFSEYRVVG